METEEQNEPLSTAEEKVLETPPMKEIIEMPEKPPMLRPSDTIALETKQMMDAPEVETIAKKVIQNENLTFDPAEVGYYLIYPNITKYMVAKCIKANREVKYFSGKDYLIEISGEVWDSLDEKTKYMLVYHELLHIDPQYNEKRQEWSFKLRKHDFGDFYQINDRHGSDWYKTIQEVSGSLYDMSPVEQGKVSL